MQTKEAGKGVLRRVGGGKYLLETAEGVVDVATLPVGMQELGGIILHVCDSAGCRDVAVDAGSVSFVQAPGEHGVPVGGLAIFGRGNCNFTFAC